MKKNILLICLALTTLFSTAFAAPTSSPSASPSSSTAVSVTDYGQNDVSQSNIAAQSFPEPHGEAAVLIDRKTGDVLYQKSKDKQMYPASTTKIMTAVLALENGNLQDSVTANHEAIDPITLEHSHMGIKVGETLSLEQLLYGMLVYSANDAANVIAVHIGGNLENFSNMMNQKATELGLTNTHYKNAHGFHEEGHYTSAQDLATLARYAMQNEKFCEIVSTGIYRIPANDKHTEERVLSTTNHLISRYRNTKYMYKYAIGVKTGFTNEAGSCLVAAATKNDVELISVILNSPTSDDGTLYSFADTISLYDYAFENYKMYKVAPTDKVVSDSSVYEAKNGTRVTLSPAQNIEKLMPKNIKDSDIVEEITLNEKIKAPIAKGDVLGNVTYLYNGQEIGTVNLIANNDVAHDKILAVIHFFTNILTNPIFIVCALIVIFLILRSNHRRKQLRKKRRNKLKYANQIKRK